MARAIGLRLRSPRRDTPHVPALFPEFRMRPILAAVLTACAILPAHAGQSITTGPWTGNTNFVKPQAQRTAPAPRPRFVTAEDIVVWMNGYRAKPEPKLLPEAVKAMVRLGVFRDMDTSGMHMGFVGGVLGANPALADGLIDKMFPMPPESQPVIIRAIAYSGLPDWKSRLANISERMPARAVLIDRFLSDKLPGLADLALDAGPQPLDTLWGHYTAHGSFEPILRIVSILKWSQDGNNVERLTVGSMAKYTLAANASRDMDLLQFLRAAAVAEPAANGKILREVIEAADLGDTSKVRKEAVAAIDTLKVKGSEASRTYNWWGTAGQTALALGCVAGSALGQTAIGVPCVLGGALSGVALKAFAPKE
jgi:hypothetical protein